MPLLRLRVLRGKGGRRRGVHGVPFKGDRTARQGAFGQDVPHRLLRRRNALRRRFQVYLRRHAADQKVLHPRAAPRDHHRDEPRHGERAEDRALQARGHQPLLRRAAIGDRRAARRPRARAYRARLPLLRLPAEGGELLRRRHARHQGPDAGGPSERPSRSRRRSGAKHISMYAHCSRRTARPSTPTI